MTKCLQLKEKKAKDITWPIDSIMKQIDNFDEILIIGKKKDGEGYTRFSTGLRSTFWWMGCLEALKQLLMSESLTTDDY